MGWRNIAMVARTASSWSNILIILVLQVELAVSVVDPYHPGPCQVSEWEYGTHRHPIADVTLHAKIWAPKCINNSATDELPVYAFVTAFGGNVGVSDYNQIFSHAASHNIVVIGYDYGGGLVPDYLQLGHKFNSANSWMADHLGAEFAAHNVSGVPDFQNQLAVGGHSAGNHIALQGLVYGCGTAKGLLMIDPVDGVDPYGFEKIYVIPTPPTRLNVTIPALHIETGLDPKSVGLGFPACAPPKLSNARFYNAMHGPTWQINATDYGHLDCIDNGTVVTVFGGLICPSNKNSNKPLYWAAVGGWVTSFIHGLFTNGEGALLDLLQSGADSPVAVLMQQKNLPSAVHSLKPSCENTPTSFS